MPTTRNDVVDALATHPPEVLGALLEAALVSPRGAVTSRELAERITTALWWSASTPLGYVATTTHLDHIVDHVARKAQVDGALGSGDAWSRLERLVVVVVGQSQGPVRWSTLSDTHRAGWTGRRWVSPLLGMSGASSLGTGWAARKLLSFGGGPITRLLPLVPYVGPWFVGIRKGAGVAAALGGPVGVLLSLLAANQALGANYQALVPLLLGVGALGPGTIADAVEV